MVIERLIIVNATVLIPGPPHLWIVREGQEVVEILKDGLLHPQEKVAGRVVEGVDHLIIIGVTPKVILDEEAKIDIKENLV